MRVQGLRGNRSRHLVSETRLKEEIEMLETRLEQMGPDGDCGYETALIRFLEQQLGMRQAMLRAVMG